MKKIILVLIITVFCSACGDYKKEKNVTSKAIPLEKERDTVSQSHNLEHKPKDTLEMIEAIHDDFVIDVFKGKMDYSLITNQYDNKRINIKIKENKHIQNQIDTLVTITINKIDTLNYYLTKDKNIFLGGRIYSNKIDLNKDLEIGLSFDDFKKMRIIEIEEEVNAKNIRISDTEGFSEIFLDFTNNGQLSKIEMESKYLD